MRNGALSRSRSSTFNIVMRAIPDSACSAAKRAQVPKGRERPQRSARRRVRFPPSAAPGPQRHGYRPSPREEGQAPPAGFRRRALPARSLPAPAEAWAGRASKGVWVGPPTPGALPEGLARGRPLDPQRCGLVSSFQPLEATGSWTRRVKTGPKRTQARARRAVSARPRV